MWGLFHFRRMSYYNFDMHPQTRRQREVLDFMVRYIESHGYRPSYQVIARHMGVSSRAGIARIIGDLESQGFLERRRTDGHFSILMARDEITPESGAVIQWLETPDDGDGNGPVPFALPECMLGGHDPGQIRAFQVPDDSLVQSGICAADIALIELRSFARDGDIVIAVIKKEKAVLRKYYRSGAEIELTAADGDDEVLTIAADSLEILGIFRGLVRPIT